MKNRSVLPTKMQAIVLSAIVGIVVALAITVVGTVLSAFMMNSGSLSENSAAFVSAILWFVSTVAATLISGKMAQSNIVPTMMSVATVYFLLLMGMKAVLFSMPFSAIGKGIGIIAAGLLPGLLVAIRGKKDKKPKFKYKS